jgi:hypothetical protein
LTPLGTVYIYIRKKKFFFDPPRHRIHIYTEKKIFFDPPSAPYTYTTSAGISMMLKIDRTPTHFDRHTRLRRNCVYKPSVFGQKFNSGSGFIFRRSFLVLCLKWDTRNQNTRIPGYQKPTSNQEPATSNQLLVSHHV